MQAGQPSLTKTFESPVRTLSKGSLVAGKYRIVEEIGRGGMGVVYKAEDTKLARQVAIKVLPEVFTADPERLARFEREARVLASLNHPNIAAIYGVEEADGQRFLVLEFVEGENLAERLSRGALTLEVTLDLCGQIADGLEGAHEKGIIHRDLKPANVKITPEGKAKILDFGLAKAYVEELTVGDIANSPTITAQMTEPGVILGTAAYMSPEQATGRPVNKRADIWTFGCILYECLTGKRAFPGDTATESMAAILRGEPDWDSLPAGTPRNVRSVLRRSLTKDPRERLRDIGDARMEMLEGLSEPAEAVPVSQQFSRLRLLSIGAALFVIGFLGGMAVMKYFKRATSPTSQPAVRSAVRLEPGHWLDGWRWSPPWGFDQPSRTAMAISSDGGFIVYSAVKENPGPQDKPCLYLRRTDQLGSTPISGTEGGMYPFLSPDDRWVGFWAGEPWAGGKLMKVSIDGGVPVPLCNAAMPFGASWGPENSIVFSPDENKGLSRTPIEGGEPEPLTTPDRVREEISHYLPYCLPDGEGVLFTIMRFDFEMRPRVALLDLKTRKWQVLLEDAADARYVPTGHLVFLRQGTLMVASFDLGKHKVTGQPVPAITNVIQALNMTNPGMNTAAGQFSISKSGWLVYAEGGILPDSQNSLVWVDQEGRAVPAAPFKAAFFAPCLSPPDGRRIAYTILGKELNDWVYDTNRGDARDRLTSEGYASWANWTPDGKRVVFTWCKSGQPNLYWQPADGSSGMERLATSDYLQAPGSFTPDGATLAFTEWHPEKNMNDIFLLDLRSRHITPFLNSGADEGWPEFSPDGRWLAYSSDESGRPEVYVRPFPGPGGKWLISHEGGMDPLWARNGKQLFYRSVDGQQVWAVDVRAEGEFSPGNRASYSKGRDSGQVASPAAGTCRRTACGS
jgi:serine/threonine-protein kinase